MNIGEYILKLRTQKGLSQRKLSKLSGVSNTEISRIESGERQKVSPDILRVVAPHLGTSYEQLMEIAGYITNTTSRLGKELSDSLINLRITIADIASNIGLPAEILYKIVKAEKGPTINDYIKLGKWLGYSEQQSKELYHEEMNFISEENTSTLAAHRVDGYDDDLPEEAKKELQSYIEYLKVKYKKKDDSKK